MIEKTAKAKRRSQRKEPEQEALVQLKDQSNERMSKLIDLYKAVIKGINGGPSPGIGLTEKINLTEPMPDIIPTAAQRAAQEAASLADFVSQIDRAQDTYSANKTEKMQKKLQDMQSRMTEMKNLQEQVTKASMVETLHKEASNKLTRLWSHITPFSWGEKGRSHRLSMLRSLARIDANLRDVENSVLGGDPDILNAVELAKQLWDDADVTFFQDFGNQLVKMVQIAEDDIERMSKELENLLGELENVKGQSKINNDLKETVRVPGGTPAGQVAPTAGASTSPLGSGQSGAQSQTLRETVQVPVDKTINLIQSVIEDFDAAQERLKADRKKMKLLHVGPDEPTTGPVPEGEGVKISPVDLNEPTTSEPPEDLNIELVDVDSDEPTTSEPPEGEVGEDSEEKETKKKKTKKTKKTTAPVQPEVSVDPLLEYAKHLWANATHLYQEIGSEASRIHKEAPDFWADRISEQWDKVEKLISKLQGSQSKRDLTINYYTLIKAFGDVKSSIDAMNHELREAGSNKDFEFGSTVDESRLDNQARAFLSAHKGQMQSVARLYDERIIVYAHTGMSRFVRRMLQHVSGGRDKAIRLRVDESLRTARQALQSMMDVLEKKNIQFRTLITSSRAFLKSIASAYDNLSKLGSMYNSRMKMEKSNHKINKTRMPYDMIPLSDLRDLKNINSRLDRFSALAEQLDNAEIEQSRLQEQYEKVKKAISDLEKGNA